MIFPRHVLRNLSRMILFAVAVCSFHAARAASFTNAAAISIPDAGSPGLAAPYPSTINVAGMTGVLAKATVTLRGINHIRPDDLEILLVSPTGAKFVLLSDAGGTLTPANNVTLTIDDAAGSFVPDTGPLASGVSKPTCVDFQTNIDTGFPSPAPSGPYNVPAPRGIATLASAFNGINPNGTWSLYVVDDVPTAGQGANIANGWSLNISNAAPLQSSTTTITSSTNPSTTGQSVIFTATVRRTIDGAIPTLGSFAFRDGATLLSTVAVNGNGQGFHTNASLSEGSHIINAEYIPPGNNNLAPSSASLTQNVEGRTIVGASNTFCNTNIIILPGTGSPGTAGPYPSHILVSGLTGTIAKVTLVLSNVAHSTPDDLEVLLVGPGGQQLVVMSDAGGSFFVTNTTLTFADTAGVAVPNSGPLSVGTYRATSYNITPAVFPPPAPLAPYNHSTPAGGSTFSNVFNGTNPNGTWSLYVVDDTPGVGGRIANGWCLSFVMTTNAPTTMTLVSSSNPALVGQSVTLTATVLRTNGLPVTAGTVSFREGTNTLAGPIAVNASGQVAFTTATFTEGNHFIVAQFNGSSAFNMSSVSITQRVDAPTIVTSNRFCNTTQIGIPDGTGPGATYPSRILVSNAGGSIAAVSVTLSNLHHPHPDDLKLLLVGPTGASMVLMSDAGGANAAAGITMILADSGSAISDSGPLVSGTNRPTSYNVSPANFPAPAPAPPYNHASPGGTATLAAVFNGTNPNGYWSLYVLDDTPGNGGGMVSNGWCLRFTTAPAISCIADIVTTNVPGQCQSAALPFTASSSGFPTPVVTHRIGGTAITSPRSFPLGTTTVISTASNSAGVASCSFNVTVQPSPAPSLAIIRSGTNVVLSWSTVLPCVNLQYTSRLLNPPASNVWTTFSGPFATNAGRIFATNNTAATNRFYRLFL